MPETEKTKVKVEKTVPEAAPEPAFNPTPFIPVQHHDDPVPESPDDTRGVSKATSTLAPENASEVEDTVKVGDKEEPVHGPDVLGLKAAATEEEYEYDDSEEDDDTDAVDEGPVEHHAAAPKKKKKVKHKR